MRTTKRCAKAIASSVMAMPCLSSASRKNVGAPLAARIRAGTGAPTVVCQGVAPGPALLHGWTDRIFMSRMQFELKATDGAARRGQLTFPRGTVQTPAFMPVGTYGTVKGILPRDLEATGAEICLGNTFHLMLRPGTGVIQKHGDLHDFMQWQKLILTDSGGFQVFSLGALRKIKEEGVTFRSPINGDKIFLG